MNWGSSSKDVIIAQIFILDQYDCIQRLLQRLREQGVAGSNPVILFTIYPLAMFDQSMLCWFWLFLITPDK